MVDVWMDYMKKHNVENINIIPLTDKIFDTEVTLSNGDYFRIKKTEYTDITDLFDEIHIQVHNHITIKDRRKKVIGLKNKIN